MRGVQGGGHAIACVRTIRTAHPPWSDGCVCVAVVGAPSVPALVFVRLVSCEGKRHGGSFGGKCESHGVALMAPTRTLLGLWGESVVLALCFGDGPMAKPACFVWGMRGAKCCSLGGTADLDLE